MIQLQENLWADGRAEGQTLLGPSAYIVPVVQQEKPWKKSQIKHSLAVLNTAGAICWKYARQSLRAKLQI